MTNLEKTLLDTIAFFEGTIGISNNGYDILFARYLIQGWTEDTPIKHRCIKPTTYLTKEIINKKGFDVCYDKTWEQKTSKGDITTAAGRYQYLGSSWASTTEDMGLGFNAPMTKLNQNLACLYTLRDKKNVNANDLEKALKSLSGFRALATKIKEEWTSFKASLEPNSKYHITIQMGYDFFKQTHDIYENK